jgi:hypothetical protein
MKSGNLNFLEPTGPLQACNGTTLPFYTIRICWFYYCFHVLKAHPLPIVFKTVFIRMANVRHLTSKLCTVCTTTWSSPSTQNRWPATISVLHLPPIHTRPFYVFEEGGTNYTRSGLHLFSEMNCRFFYRTTASDSCSVHSLVESDQWPQLSFFGSSSARI